MITAKMAKASFKIPIEDCFEDAVSDQVENCLFDADACVKVVFSRDSQGEKTGVPTITFAKEEFAVEFANSEL